MFHEPTLGRPELSSGTIPPALFSRRSFRGPHPLSERASCGPLPMPGWIQLSSSFFRFSSTIVQLSSETALACSDGMLRSVTVSSVDPS